MCANEILRMRVFPTVGDELILQNAADQAKVKLEIGGPPECNGTISGFEREPEDKCGGPSARWDWFVAYLIGTELQIKHTKSVFFDMRDGN